MPPKGRRKEIPAGNVYPAVTPRPYVLWTFLALAALAGAAAFHVPRPPAISLLEYKFEFVVFIAAAVFFVWTALSSTAHRVEIHGAVLRFYGGFFYRNVQADEIDIAAARIVDLAVDREFRPVWWLYGIGLPGYLAGLYLLHRGGQGWVVLTGPGPFLWLPRKEGRPYLLSLKDGAGLLARLQKYASRQEAGGEK